MKIDPVRLPLPEWVTVHLCVNDGQGIETGLLSAVVLHDEDGEQVVTFAADDDGEEVTIEMVPNGDRRMFLGGDRPCEPFDFRSYRAYIGNICWDGGVLVKADALRLARELIARGYHVEECASEAVIE